MFLTKLEFLEQLTVENVSKRIHVLEIVINVPSLGKGNNEMCHVDTSDASMWTVGDIMPKSLTAI